MLEAIGMGRNGSGSVPRGEEESWKGRRIWGIALLVRLALQWSCGLAAGISARYLVARALILFAPL